MQIRLLFPRRLLGLFGERWAREVKASHGQPEINTQQRDSIYKAIIESIPIGVAITDLKGNINYFSPQAEALTSFKEQSIKGKNLGQIFSAIAPDFKRRIEEEREWVEHLSFSDSKGRNKHLKLTLIPSSKWAIRPKSFVLLFEDVTRMQEIEEMVRLEEKLTAAKQHESAEQLRPILGKEFHFEGVIGQSKEMQAIYRLIQKAAATTANVLMSGESGTGREMIARAIHMSGPRRNKPFVSVNCGGILETLLEDELFGHIRGAFTGAVSDQPGRLKLADEGTIFLDEVEKLPPHLQGKLLKVLEYRSFTPVGGTKPLGVDLRVISASNKDLKREVDERKFRKDLFYRLCVIQIDLPPLRNRKEDIPFLVQHFINKFAQASNKQVEDISPEALRYLMYYNYPENIRELESIVEHAVAVTDRDVLTEGDLPLFVRQSLPFDTKPILSPEDAKLLESTTPPHEDSFFGQGLSLDDAIVFYEKNLLFAALKKGAEFKRGLLSY